MKMVTMLAMNVTPIRISMMMVIKMIWITVPTSLMLVRWIMTMMESVRNIKCEGI